jgi:hypothetical protein
MKAVIVTLAVIRRLIALSNPFVKARKMGVLVIAKFLSAESEFLAKSHFVHGTGAVPSARGPQ